jgi:hypothetical protein
METLAIIVIVLSILGIIVAIVQKEWTTAMWAFNTLVWVTQYLLK